MNEVNEHTDPKDYQKYQNFPVKVYGVTIDWLMNNNNTIAPLNFLKSLYDKDNVEVFKIKSIEMIVELLFSRFKYYI